MPAICTTNVIFFASFLRRDTPRSKGSTETKGTRASSKKRQHRSKRKKSLEHEIAGEGGRAHRDTRHRHRITKRQR
eukprot:2347743-Rhodomonas_salina.2